MQNQEGGVSEQRYRRIIHDCLEETEKVAILIGLNSVVVVISKVLTLTKSSLICQSTGKGICHFLCLLHNVKNNIDP